MLYILSCCKPVPVDCRYHTYETILTLTCCNTNIICCKRHFLFLDIKNSENTGFLTYFWVVVKVSGWVTSVNGCSPYNPAFLAWNGSRLGKHQSGHSLRLKGIKRQIQVIGKSVITPHVCDMSGVIVLTSCVCVCVCASVSLSWVDGQTYGLEFWHGGQVEGYLGQVRRSKVKVTRSNNVHWDTPLTSESLVCSRPAKQETHEYNVGCFQSVCVFFVIGKSVILVSTKT